MPHCKRRIVVKEEKQKGYSSSSNGNVNFS